MRKPVTPELPSGKPKVIVRTPGMTKATPSRVINEAAVDLSSALAQPVTKPSQFKLNNSKNDGQIPDKGKGF